MIGNLSDIAVEELAHRLRALLEIEERVDGAADDDRNEDAVVLQAARQVDDQLRERRQVRAEALEQLFELRDHEDQQDDGDDDGDARAPPPGRRGPS